MRTVLDLNSLATGPTPWHSAVITDRNAALSLSPCDKLGVAHPEIAESENGSVQSADSSWWSLQFLLLLLATSTAFYARTSLGPLQESIRLGLGFTDNQMALLQGPALAVPLLVTALPLGTLIYRYSRARVLTLSAFGCLLGSLWTVFTGGFASLFMARCLIGLTAPAISMTVCVLCADLFRPARRGRANMILAIGQVAGTASAFALGGTMLDRFALTQNAWRWAMLVLTCPLAVVAVSTFFVKDPPRSEPSTLRNEARSAPLDLWRYRVIVLPLLAGMVMVSIADGAAMTWVAPALSRGLALSSSRVGSIMSIALVVSGIVGPIVGGFVADLAQKGGGPRRTFLVLSAMAFASAAGGLFPVAPDVVSACILLVAFITVGSATSVIVTTQMTIVVLNELRGLCMAILTATGVLFGIGFAPLAVSLLSEELGGVAMIGRALSIVCVSTSLAGMAAFVMGRKRFAARRFVETHG